MDGGSLVTAVGDGAANLTAAASASNLWLDLPNASSPTTLWGSGRGGGSISPTVSNEPEEQLLIPEQAYRDFTTTIQVFILIGSLLGESDPVQPSRLLECIYLHQVHVKFPTYYSGLH